MNLEAEKSPWRMQLNVANLKLIGLTIVYMNKSVVWLVWVFFNDFLKGVKCYVGSFLVYEQLTQKIISHSFKNAIFVELQAYIYLSISGTVSCACINTAQRDQHRRNQ